MSSADSTTAAAVTATVAATRARASYKGAITCNQFLRQGLYEPTVVFLLRLIVVAFCWPAALGNFYACGHSLQSVLFAQLTASATNDGASPRTIRVMLEENGSGRTLSPITRQPAHKIRSLVAKYGLTELLEQADCFVAKWWTDRSPAGQASAEQMATAHGQALVLNRHMVISHLLFKETAAGLYMTYAHGVSTTARCLLGERLHSRPASDTAYVPHTGCLGYFDQIWANISKSIAELPEGRLSNTSAKGRLAVAIINSIETLFVANAPHVLHCKAQPRIRDSGKTSAGTEAALMFGLRPEDITSPAVCGEGLGHLLEFQASEALLSACSAALQRAKMPLADQVRSSAHITKFLAGRTAAELPTGTEHLIVEWCGALHAGQLVPTLPSGSKSFKEPLVYGPISRMVHWIVLQAEPSFYSLRTDNNDLGSLMLNMPPAARVLFGYQPLHCAESAADGVTADSVNALCQTLRAGADFNANRIGDDDSLGDDTSSASTSSHSAPGSLARRRRSATAILPPLDGGASKVPVVICTTMPQSADVAALSLLTNASLLALYPPPTNNHHHHHQQSFNVAALLAQHPPAAAAAPAPATKKRIRTKKPAAIKAARPDQSDTAALKARTLAAPMDPATASAVAAFFAADDAAYEHSLVQSDGLRTTAMMLAESPPPSAIGYHCLYSDAMAANTPRPLTKQERRRASMENWALLEAAIHSNLAFRAARGLSVFRQLYDSVGSPFAAIAPLQPAYQEFGERLRWIVPAEHSLLSHTIQQKLCSLDSLRLLFTNQAVGEARQSILDAGACIGLGDFRFPSYITTPSPLACENIMALIDEADGLLGLDQCPRETLERALLGNNKKWTDAVILIQIFSALSPAASPDNINRQLLVDIWPALAYAWSRVAFAWLEKWPLMTSGLDSTDITAAHVNQCAAYWYSVQAGDSSSSSSSTNITYVHPPSSVDHSKSQLFVVDDEPLPMLPAPESSFFPDTSGIPMPMAPTIIRQDWALNSTASCLPGAWAFPDNADQHQQQLIQLPSVTDSTDSLLLLPFLPPPLPRTATASSESSVSTTTTAQSYGGSPVEVAMPLLPPIRMEKRAKKQQLAPMLLNPHAIACIPQPEPNQLGFVHPRKSNPFDNVHATFMLPPSSSDRSLIDSLWNHWEPTTS